jgi:tRNA/rRNA methyltransferase
MTYALLQGFLGQIVVVLDRPQDPLNIGAVVRAMKNMGFHRLRLVQPAPFDRSVITRLAHRSEDLIDQISIHADLDSALADVHFVVGTDAQPHSDYPVTGDVRGLASNLLQRAAAGQQIALLFGTESDGLDRVALDRCHVIAVLPTDPAYPALNLAQAVLIFLYELRTVAFNPLPAAADQPALMSQADLTRLFALVEQALSAVGFFKYNPQMVMRSLRQMAYRAELTPDDAALLMAIARQALRSVGNVQSGL